MEEGKIVTSIPPISRATKSGINWDRYAELARQTGQPVLAGKSIKDSHVKSVRQRHRPPFITPEGRIAVRLRNSHVDPRDGYRYGDVYLEWIPEDNTGEADAAFPEHRNTTTTQEN